MEVLQLMYCLGSLALIVWLVSKAENKWFITCILFWLYSPPILADPRYTLSISFAGIDLQSDRILFLLLIFTLFLFILKVKSLGKSIFDFSIARFRLFELWMVIYIVIAVLILILNLSDLGARTVIVNTVKLFTFLLVYFFARECVSPHDFRLLAVAVVTFGILSSLVGIYQFFVDPNFFRYGVLREAFGTYLRANGFFGSEYEQGIFLTWALIIGMAVIRNFWIRFLTVTIIPMGVLFTMHRASWIILLVALGVIMFKGLRNKLFWILLGALGVILIVFGFINIPWKEYYSGSFLSQMVSSRVQSNTWDVRMAYNRFALEMIVEYPLGIGDYSSNIYNKEVHKRSLDFMYDILIVHNGPLSAGVLYGIAGSIAFILFLFTSLYYFTRKGMSGINGPMAGLIILTFMIINISQDFSFLGNQVGILLGLLLGISLSLNPYFEAHLQTPVQDSDHA
jgi:hypothetical protein